MLHSLQWPAPEHYLYLGDYPDDSNPGWTNNIQGVTQDAAGAHWFFTQDVKLWKIPVSHDLDADIDDGDFPSTSIPPSLILQGANHMGDSDHHEGFVYVPVEGPSPGRVALFRASDLAFIGSAPVGSQGGSLPWCAVNPRNGLLYSSPFDTDHLCVYRRLLVANNVQGVVGFELEQLYDFPLFTDQGVPLFLARVQGGAFSPSGHLYLVSDTDKGGLMGFDMTTGRRVSHRTKESLPTDVEMEGVTIFDLDAATAPHIRGQIHIVWLQDEAIVDDDIYFSHFGFPPEERHKI